MENIVKELVWNLNQYFQLFHSHKKRKDFPFLMTMIKPTIFRQLQSSNGSTWKRCEIGLELTIETPERRYWRLSGIFIVNFEHISLLVLVFLMLYEQANARWAMNFSHPTGIYMFKVNSRNTRTTRCESCNWRRSFKCLLLTLNIFYAYTIFWSWETREDTTPYTIERLKIASWDIIGRK